MNSFVTFARRAAFALLLVVGAPSLTGAVSLVTADAAHAAVASSITVRGNQRVEAATIRSYMTIKVGKNYTAVDVDDSVKALYATSLFSDVSIVPSGSTLIVTVVENPIINSVIFEGNKKIKAEVLVQIITLQTRGVLTDAKLQTDLDRIKEYYARNGRSAASVFPRVTRLTDNRVDVAFVIDEGDKTGVASITFVGNEAFSSQRLKSVIQTRRTNWLSWLNKRDIYSPEGMAADEEALRRFYLEHGYADFVVLSADATLDPTDQRYHLTFTLEEGDKYKLGAIAVDSSIPGVDSNSLQRVVQTKAGDTFNATEVDKSVEDLTIELSRLGFVFAQVRPRGDRDYTNHIITITYVIDEGPRAYIERIEIRGNTKTRDYVIRREFDISEGDAYNRVLIDKAERRLRNLGFFKTVSITAQQGSAPDKVVVVVNVEDQSTGSFSVAGGVSTRDGFIAEVAIEETNFLGRGQHVKVSVSGGKDDRSYTLSFTDPYFLGYPFSAGFDAYHTIAKSTSLQPFGSTTTGGGLRVGLPLNDHLRADLNYKLSNKTITGAGTVCAPGTVTACYFPDSTRLTSSAGYALTFSTIDNYADPHDGVFVKLTQDIAGIGGSSAYVRTVGDARLYRPIGAKTDIVGMVRVQGGNITGLGKPVAIGDNFFKGGETIRGFAPLGYGPRDTYGTAGTTGAGMALGGKNYAAATAEVQFPIPFLPPDFGLKGAVFADAGVLFGVDTANCPVCFAGNATTGDTAVRSSVGASILWASPFGQLRLDFAQALTKQPYDNTQLVRLGAGATF